MAYDAHYRVTLSGILGTVANPVDGFSLGVALSATLAQAPLNWETAVRDACTAMWARNTSNIASHARLREVKISLKAPTGLDAAPSKRFAVDVAGGGAGPGYPHQVAWAVSLGAASDTRRAKGRFYLPCPVGAWTGATNLVADVDVAATADSMKTWLDALETASGEKVVVASSIDGNHTITTIRLGNKYDTVRSRRNALPETYTSRSI